MFARLPLCWPSIAVRSALLLSALVLGGSRLCAEEAGDGSTSAAAGFEAPPLQVSRGFVVELAAAPPLVMHPTMAGFDDRGRLYVADGQGMNLKKDDLLAQLPNNIRRLEDTNGDGVFDKSTIFADNMTFPMGALWHDGSLYVASPPNIWKLTDEDDDGVAEKREILVSEFGFTGNAADIHGCFLGPDGRIYWCDGRHGHTFVDEQGRVLSKGLAARIFSCRTDGSQVEVFAGGGMDNPVEVTFSEEGELFGTAAIFDRIDGRHDALIHWVYGGVYPWHQCVSEFKHTGEVLPALSRFGQVAPSGVMRYRGSHFGAQFRDNILLAQFNTHRVVRTQIERDGATFRSQDEDFLVSPSPDFHPTDVLEDADGSLLVVDTGGWFRIGCPLSEIAKPEILGAIYRVRRVDGPVADDPRGLALDWDAASDEQLVARLDDARPAVRDRTLALLAGRGHASVPALSRSLSRPDADATLRRNAVWALCRIDTRDARAALREALGDADASVRQSAARALGTLRDKPSVEPLVRLLADTEQPASLRREAATALGRLGDVRAVPVLLNAVRDGGDRFFEHALIYALIEISHRDSTLAGLADSAPAVRRAALIALDQMDGGGLTRELVGPLLDTGDASLQRAALEVIQRREGWAAETVGLMQSWLAAPKLSADRQAMARGALLAFRRDAATQDLVARVLADKGTPADARLLLLEVVARSEMDAEQLPCGWVEPLAAALADADRRIVRQAVAVIAATGVRRFDQRLLDVAGDQQADAELRVAALAVLAAHGQPLDDGCFEFLLARLDADLPPVDRLAAAEALGAARLEPSQLRRLAPRLAETGPLELPALVSAFAGEPAADLGLALVAALEKSPGVDNLPPTELEKLLGAYPHEVQAAAAALLKRLNIDRETQRARLNELAIAIDGGDPARGKLVFASKKTSCSACHRVAGEGATIGPDLTKIGQIRSKLDLLEAVIFPSASFARGYEAFSVVTASGQIHTGILSRESSDSVFLQTAQREEIRVARGEIEEMAPSRVSIMPQGLERVMSDAELRDLMAYLQSLK